MVAGGALIAVIAPKRRIHYVIGGTAASCFALAATGLPSQNMFPLAVLFWTISAIAYSMGSAPFTAVLQSVIPNEMQGRVLSLLSMLMGMGAPLGLVVATPLGEIIGVRWLFVLLGTVGGLISLLGFLSPAIRKIDERTSS